MAGGKKRIKKVQEDEPIEKEEVPEDVEEEEQKEEHTEENKEEQEEEQEEEHTSDNEDKTNTTESEVCNSESEIINSSTSTSTSGYQSTYVKIFQDESSKDFIELPREKDGTILLSTVQSQFPGAIGLRYKSSTGGWRGIRLSGNVLDPPFGGWADNDYCVSFEKGGNRKRKGEIVKSDPAKHARTDLLKDLVVLGLPYDTTNGDLKEYFTANCGEVKSYSIKYHPETRKSRGFGFIRFKNEEAAEKALNEDHFINGRKLIIKKSNKKETPMKLFVGRLAKGTTREEVFNHFCKFGEIIDNFVSISRGFGFVTFASADVGRAVLRESHIINGSTVEISVAEPRKDKLDTEFRQRQNSNTNQNFSQPRDFQQSAPPDLATQLKNNIMKNLLVALIQNSR